MNCVGCHCHGGGGMGPALMDDQWRYGGRIDQIAATIAEGRPNGMPVVARQADRPADLAARRLCAHPVGSGAARTRSAARADELSNTPPQTLAPGASR